MCLSSRGVFTHRLSALATLCFCWALIIRAPNYWETATSTGDNYLKEVEKPWWDDDEIKTLFSQELVTVYTDASEKSEHGRYTLKGWDSRSREESGTVRSSDQSINSGFSLNNPDLNLPLPESVPGEGVAEPTEQVPVTMQKVVDNDETSERYPSHSPSRFSPSSMRDKSHSSYGDSTRKFLTELKPRKTVAMKESSDLKQDEAKEEKKTSLTAKIAWGQVKNAMIKEERMVVLRRYLKENIDIPRHPEAQSFRSWLLEVNKSGHISLQTALLCHFPIINGEISTGESKRSLFDQFCLSYDRQNSFPWMCKVASFGPHRDLILEIKYHNGLWLCKELGLNLKLWEMKVYLAWNLQWAKYRQYAVYMRRGRRPIVEMPLFVLTKSTVILLHHIDQLYRTIQLLHPDFQHINRGRLIEFELNRLTEFWLRCPLFGMEPPKRRSSVQDNCYVTGLLDVEYFTETLSSSQRGKGVAVHFIVSTLLAEWLADAQKHHKLPFSSHTTPNVLMGFMSFLKDLSVAEYIEREKINIIG